MNEPTIAYDREWLDDVSRARDRSDLLPNLIELARRRLDDCERLQDEVKRLKAITEKVAWHRRGHGPDVPVLQDRYDILVAERDILLNTVEKIQKMTSHDISIVKAGGREGRNDG
jgi:hypothetical protein